MRDLATFLFFFFPYNWAFRTGFEAELKITGVYRDIEVKNNLTMDRGEWGGDSGKRGLQELL